jgi:hypothetical protein
MALWLTQPAQKQIPMTLKASSGPRKFPLNINGSAGAASLDPGKLCPAKDRHPPQSNN